jgi:hypothetical protein
MASPMQTLYAASLPESSTILNLSPTDQSRLATYIRECEVERRVSAARLENLQGCSVEESPLGPSSSFVLSVFAAIALGYALGRMDNR